MIFDERHFFKNNQNLLKSGIERTLSMDEQREYLRCKLDPVYFLKKYAKIVHMDHGLIPLDLYPYQEEVVELYGEGHNRLIMNTCRQSGKTTVIVGIILHYAIFNSEKRIAILANKADQAQEILSRIQLAFEYLPLWLKPGVGYWAQRRLTFDNGTSIIAAASSSSSIRGKSVSLLYLDEQAFIPNWEDFSASVLPTISSGKTTIMIMTSTPNGLNSFYDYCKLAKANKNGFKYVEVPWYKVPGRDDNWRLKTFQELNYDLNRFKIEHECQFEGSSDTLLSGAALKGMRPVLPVKEDGMGTAKQYEAPIENRVYVAVADVSRGKGLDYSTTQIIDVTELPYKQVFTYRNNQVTPIEFSSILYRLCSMYNNAYALIEINDIGGQVADALFYEFDYEYVLCTDSSGGRTGKRISGGFGKRVDRGIRTTTPVKSIGCSIIKLLIEENKLLIQDANTIFELSTFSKHGNSYAAEDGKHDDLVMPLVLFAWLTQDTWFSNIRDVNVMANLRQVSESDIEEAFNEFRSRDYVYDDGSNNTVVISDGADTWYSTSYNF